MSKLRKSYLLPFASWYTQQVTAGFRKNKSHLLCRGIYFKNRYLCLVLIINYNDQPINILVNDSNKRLIIPYVQIFASRFATVDWSRIIYCWTFLSPIDDHLRCSTTSYHLVLLVTRLFIGIASDILEYSFRRGNFIRTWILNSVSKKMSVFLLFHTTTHT